MSVFQALKAFWETIWGKLTAGAVFGFVLAMFVVPSLTSVTESTEEVRKELETRYEAKLQESTKQLEQTKESYEKELTQLQTEAFSKQEEFKTKIQSLTTEVSSLRKNTFTETVEIRKPDGTVEKRKTTHSTLETINQKVAEVKEESEKRLKEELAKQQEKHERDTKEIATIFEMEFLSMREEVESVKEREEDLKKSYEKKVKNARRVGVGVGYTSDKAYAGHAHYYWNPSFFVGTGVDYRPDTEHTSASVMVGVGF